MGERGISVFALNRRTWGSRDWLTPSEGSICRISLPSVVMGVSRKKIMYWKRMEKYRAQNDFSLKARFFWQASIVLSRNRQAFGRIRYSLGATVSLEIQTRGHVPIRNLKQ